MKFGLYLPNNLAPICDATSIKATARLAEDIGFDSLWVADHVLVPKEHWLYGQGTEPLITLGYLAAMTSKITLGTSVLVFPLRNPLVVAKQVATLAEFSGREIILGVGVGSSTDEYGYHNIDFHRRGKLQDEYIKILRKLWGDDNPTHEGTYTFSDVHFSPRPTIVPKIWVAGNANATVKRAAMLGDGYIPTIRTSPEVYAQQLAAIDDHQPEREITKAISLPVMDLPEGSQAIIDFTMPYLEAGAEYPVFGLHYSGKAHESLGELLRVIESVGKEVLPQLREFKR